MIDLGDTIRDVLKQQQAAIDTYIKTKVDALLENQKLCIHLGPYGFDESSDKDSVSITRSCFEHVMAVGETCSYSEKIQCKFDPHTVEPYVFEYSTDE